MAKLFIITLAGLGCLSACMSRDPVLREDFGAAVRHNQALQVINPEGVEQDDSTVMDGQQAEGAVERYREGPQEQENETLLIDLGGGN